MTISSAGSPPVVIDASLAAGIVLPLPTSDTSRALLARWYEEDRALLAPVHWLSESVSVVRKLRFADRLSSEECSRAVDDLLALGIEAVDADRELCHEALRWAERLHQSKAYDAFYLALAEREGAELWTHDHRLGRRARQLGADWVRTPDEAR